MVESLTNTPVEKRWRGQERPMPVVVAIIHRDLTGDSDKGGDSSYLLIRRTSGPYNDHWALVGGKWDFGETLAEAVIREVKEETGLTTSFNALRGLVNERVIKKSDAEAGSAQFIIFICQVEAGTGQAREQDEGAVAWFTGREIDDLNEAGAIIPSDYAMLQHFVGGDSVPFYEAVMRSSSIEGGGLGSTELTRFELID